MLATSGSPTRLTPLADAFAAIDAVAPSPARETALESAAGQVLAADVTAPRALPEHEVALYDGFAVVAEATLDASAHAPMALAATPVEAGDAMPKDTDAVATFDHVQMCGERAEAITPVAPGEGVRRAGEDCAQGFVLRRRGERLRRIDIGVLAAAGVTRVHVHVPRLILATDADANVRAALPDIVLDVRPAKFFDGAERVMFNGVGIAPGEQAALGLSGDTCVLLLPDQLDEALAAWMVLGKRLLRRLTGDASADETIDAELTRKVVSTVSIADFVPVRVQDGKAEPLAAQHLPLSALARANGYILVPPQSEGYAAGTAVKIHPWL